MSIVENLAGHRLLKSLIYKLFRIQIKAFKIVWQFAEDMF